MTEYTEFRLRIERGSRKGSYRVEASSLGATRTGPFRRPFSDTDLENFVLKVGRTRRGVRRIESPEWDLAKTFGSKLFAALIDGPVAELYREAYAQARASKQGLRITLSLTDVPEVGAIPWEYLYDDPNFLSISTSTPVVRYLDLPHPRQPLPVELPIRILGVVSGPSDYPALDTGAERAKLEAALKPLVEAGAVSIEWLEEANLLALAKRMRKDTFQILHFIGHGGFDEASGQGALLLEDSDGRGRITSGEQLATVLHDKTSLRLVFLNSCEGARNSVDDPFSGVATSLVERDIPAVIGMQFEITDRAAVLFASEFYAMLAEGRPVDAAVTEARLAIFADHNDVEWATPVLFLRVADGRLFDVANAGAIPRPDPVALVARVTEAAAAATVVPALGAESTAAATVVPALEGEAPASPTSPGAPPPVMAPSPAPAPPPEPAPTPPGAPRAPGASAVPVEPPGPQPPLHIAAQPPLDSNAIPGNDASLPIGRPQAPVSPDPRAGSRSTGSIRRHWRPIALASALGIIVLVAAAAQLLQPYTVTPLAAPVLSVTYPGPGTAHLHGYGFAPDETVYVGLNRTTITEVAANSLGWIDRDFSIGDLASGLFTAVSDSGRTAATPFQVPFAGTSRTPADSPTSTASAAGSAAETTAGCDRVGPATTVAPAVSPGILVYTHIKRGERGKREIYLVTAPGSRPQQVTDGTTDDTFPAWSPDHTRIAFSRGGRIHVGSFIDGTIVGPVPVTSGAADAFPAWSSNDCIAFVRRGSGIWRVNPDGTGEKPVVEDETAGAPDWSPDGLTIAYMTRRDGQYDIFTVDSRGRTTRRLSSQEDEVTPKWSPDGTRILFARGAVGTDEQDVYVVDVEANVGTPVGIAVPLTDTQPGAVKAVRDSNPVWSPTGDQIAFYRGPRATEDYRIWTMGFPAAFETARQLTPDALGPVLDPAWR